MKHSRFILLCLVHITFSTFLLGHRAMAAGELLSKGIFTSADELASLPTSGAAWQNILKYANRDASSPDLTNQEDETNVRVLAKALVYARTGQTKYRDEVIQSVMNAIGTQGGSTPSGQDPQLALSRELAAYVIAADLVGLPADKDAIFRNFLTAVRNQSMNSRTLISTHEDRPNNWGTHAGGSRIAVAAYLGDSADLQRAANVFKGWLGDRAAYSEFKYGALDWQCDPAKPVGINPKNCMKSGHPIDGVLADDQRRSSVAGGAFTWPPPKEPYVWEALQGALLQAIILHRAGYDVFNWSDKALLRAANWIYQSANFPPSGDDEWQPSVFNYYYGTKFASVAGSQPGKNVGFTDWIYAVGTGAQPVPPSSTPPVATPVPTPLPIATLKYSAAADTTLKEQYSTTNYGSQTELRADGRDSGQTNAESSLIKFNVSGIGARKVLKAHLRLKTLEASDLGGHFYRSGSNWSESQVTSKTAPAIGSMITSINTPVASGVVIEVPMESYITGDGTYTIRIQSSTTDKLRFSSREGSFKPELVLDVR